MMIGNLKKIKKSTLYTQKIDGMVNMDEFRRIESKKLMLKIECTNRS